MEISKEKKKEIAELFFKIFNKKSRLWKIAEDSAEDQAQELKKLSKLLEK